MHRISTESHVVEPLYFDYNLAAKRDLEMIAFVRTSPFSQANNQTLLRASDRLGSCGEKTLLLNGSRHFAASSQASWPSL